MNDRYQSFRHHLAIREAIAVDSVTSPLRMLAAMRAARGQTFRAKCIRAVATELEELSPGEMAMVGIGRVG